MTDIYGVGVRRRVRVTFLAPVSVIIDTYNPNGSNELIQEAKKAFYREEYMYPITPKSQLTPISTEEIKRPL